MELILASTSPYRRALLGRLGVPFRVAAPNVDEDVYKAHGWPPHVLALELAVLKAAAVSSAHPGAHVIGSDQVADLDGVMLGKPGTVEAAVDQLRALRGRTHRLTTSVAIFGSEFEEALFHTEETLLTMRSLDDDAIRRYVEVDQPLDCAGSYKIEARGITLFERIEAKDFTAIEGLPLIGLTSMLRGLGFVIP